MPWGVVTRNHLPRNLMRALDKNEWLVMGGEFQRSLMRSRRMGPRKNGGAGLGARVFRPAKPAGTPAPPVFRGPESLGNRVSLCSPRPSAISGGLAV